MNVTKSAEFKYALAGAGALAGVYVSPIVNKALNGFGQTGQAVGNLAIGVVAFIGGMYIKNDDISAFLVGLGVTFFVEGLLRFFMPNATPFNSVAVASTQTQAPASKSSGSWY